MKNKKLLKNIIAFGLLCLLVYLSDIKQLWLALSELTISSVAYLLLISVLLIYISALKWQLFVSALGEKVSIFRLFNLYLVGYFVNLLLPSYVGGDVVRSWYLGKKVGQHEAAAATILERYTGLVAMISLALIFMWFVPLVSVEIKVVVGLIALGLGLITLIALSARVSQLLARTNLPKPFFDSIAKIQASFKLVRGSRALLAKTLILSYFYHSVTVLNTIVAGVAVGWFNPPAGELFVVLPLILLVGSIPLSPSGLGIQEGAFYFFLQGVGATPAQALGVAVVLRAKSYLLAFIGWFSWLGVKGQRVEDSLSPESKPTII